MVRPAPPSGGGKKKVPLRARAYVPPTHGPVTAKEIYYLLLQQGFSTTQAEGIMANMWAESHLDPESDGVDSNGYRSVGLINWNTAPGNYPHASSLVTGNPQQDVRAQIKYLTTSTNGINPGTQGRSAADVAGNFAANVEGCDGCNAGNTTTPNGWGFRRGYAAQFTQAVATGNWANIKTSSFSGSGQSPSSGTAGPSNQANCAIGWSGVSVPLIGSVGSFCLLHKSQARAIVGATLLGFSALAALPIVAIMVITFAGRTRAGQAVAGAGGSVLQVAGGITAAAGAPELGAPLAAAGSAVKRGNAPAAAGRYARRARTTARAADAEQQRNDAAQERHTAAQYRRQPRARANRERDDERESSRQRARRYASASSSSASADPVPF